MDGAERTRITQTLSRIRDGKGAVEDLLPTVYEELHGMAQKWFRGAGANATLQPTALVHEAYLHLVDQSSAHWNDRAHFLAVAALAMRQIVIQRARARGAAKRGGGMHRVELEMVGESVGAARVAKSGATVAQSAAELLALDEALLRLATLNPRHARVVELRFFGGLTAEETATVLGVSLSTVELDWRTARAWLKGALADSRGVDVEDRNRRGRESG